MESAKRMRVAMSQEEEDTTSQGSAGGGVAASSGLAAATEAEMAVVASEEQMGSAETEDHIQRILVAIDNYTRQVSEICWMPGARCSRTSPPTWRSASARSTRRGLSGGRRRSGSCAPATPPTSRPAPSSTTPSCTSSTPYATSRRLLNILCALQHRVSELTCKSLLLYLVWFYVIMHVSM
ncbi:unnamed protein product [Urochloa humidicola]